MIEAVFKFLSAEWLLNKNPNSGYIVFLRSIIVTIILYSIAIGFKSWMQEHSRFEFSSQQFRIEISNTIPWLGAIFAGVYTAFYTRFSSQWNYLATLYNQLMEVRVLATQDTDINNVELLHWEAGFVEDAINLHLASKSMFAPAIKQFLENNDLREIFLETTLNGDKKIEKLKKQLNLKIP